MALKTPSRDQRANYGSFASSCGGSSRALGPGSRSGSGGDLARIPEDQCLLHFTSPRLQHYEEEKLAEYHEMEQSYAHGTTTTVKITASSALRMLLLGGKPLEKYAASTSSSSSTCSNESSGSDYSYTSIPSRKGEVTHVVKHVLSSSAAAASTTTSTRHDEAALFSYLNGSFAAENTAELATAHADDKTSSEQLNYWVLERERLRATRERRHLLSKKAALSGDVVADGEPASAWRTGAIMCSVPLLLVVLFAIFVLLSGESSAGSVAPSAWEFIVSTVTGKTSADSSASASAEIARRAALRGANVVVAGV
ncbi:hypothetical protein PybrP1_005897 [[Pythium] brassicae (nom. inval.)]|nr:hypothetical protein PybrP1_005897 [[Pythium] brassicae (nom. inval.)]